jgi:hypothetical protein
LIKNWKIRLEGTGRTERLEAVDPGGRRIGAGVSLVSQGRDAGVVFLHEVVIFKLLAN